MPRWAQHFWSLQPNSQHARASPLAAEPGPSAKLPQPPPAPSRERGDVRVVQFAVRHERPRPTRREYYSGRGRLSAALCREGVDTVEVEAMKSGMVDPERDMGSSSVVDRAMRDIEAGRVLYARIGIVCSSWFDGTYLQWRHTHKVHPIW